MKLLTTHTGRPPAAAAGVPREKLTLANGIPVTLALLYGTGRQVASRIPGAPDQAMFTFTDGRIGYFPLEVAAEIEALNLEHAEPFTICKHGPNKWSVGRPQAEKLKEAARLPPTAPHTISNGHQQPQHNAPKQNHWEDEPTWEELGEPAAAPPARMNGNRETAAALSAAMMRRCYDSAIGQALVTLSNAKAAGLPLAPPTFEDIRCMAATLIISESRR